ncbi:MAG: RNA pseudouridine synthase [Chlamydiae bacterium]|nr:RNA pseudouridine synthase [Chlamydiota bacterium]
MEPIYLDNHILILVKPAGIASQPDFHEEAKRWLKTKLKKPEAVFLHPVHRLDKPASGLMLFARTSKALSRLNEAMRLRKIKKTYFAWVEGELETDKGQLHHFLIHESYLAKVEDLPKKNAKSAILQYQCIKRRKGRSLVEIELDTGRYHQIRAQFGHIGHPIANDRKYGSKVQTSHDAIELYHAKLQFPHPVLKKILEFTWTPPKLFIT